jgi:hypothetical protein
VFLEHENERSLDLPSWSCFDFGVDFQKYTTSQHIIQIFGIGEEAHWWGTRNWDIPKIWGQEQDGHLRNHTTLPNLSKIDV